MHLFPSTRWAMIAIALLLVAAAAIAIPGRRASADDPQRFTFGLWGDVPYAKAGNTAEVPLMINDMNAANLAFTVFNGDTKDGSSRCDDSGYVEAAARFNSTTAPTVYVVGDNEWTDCHRTNNGNFNGLERLDYLRRTMFNTIASFGKTTMPLEHQGPVGGKYAENTRWIYGNVAFIGLNMVGSNNNFVLDAKNCDDGGRSKRTMDDCLKNNLEAASRDQANIDWMRQTFAIARQRNLAGVMIVAQADLSFDVPETLADERSDPNFNGLTRFIDAMVEETQKYAGQVVYVHGDTHHFKVDKPLSIDPTVKSGNRYLFNDNSRVIPNLTRVETFGNTNVNWVKVTVDPTSRNVFIFEPMMLRDAAFKAPTTPIPTATPAGATATPIASPTATATATPKP